MKGLNMSRLSSLNPHDEINLKESEEKIPEQQTLRINEENNLNKIDSETTKSKDNEDKSKVSKDKPKVSKDKPKVSKNKPKVSKDKPVKETKVKKENGGKKAIKLPLILICVAVVAVIFSGAKLINSYKSQEKSNSQIEADITLAQEEIDKLKVEVNEKQDEYDELKAKADIKPCSLTFEDISSLAEETVKDGETFDIRHEIESDVMTVELKYSNCLPSNLGVLDESIPKGALLNYDTNYDAKDNQLVISMDIAIGATSSGDEELDLYEDIELGPNE